MINKFVNIVELALKRLVENTKSVDFLTSTKKQVKEMSEQLEPEGLEFYCLLEDAILNAYQEVGVLRVKSYVSTFDKACTYDDEEQVSSSAITCFTSVKKLFQLYDEKLEDEPEDLPLIKQEVYTTFLASLFNIIHSTLSQPEPPDDAPVI